VNYAGFWIRVGAYLIDAIILYVVNMIIFGVFGLSMMPAANAGLSEEALGGTVWLVYLLTLVLNWVYFAVMESSARQATLGKMALGLTVTGEGGQRISFARATGRYFAKILSGLVLMIGYIMVGFTQRKQGLHDMLASTLVLKARPGEAAVDPGVFA
jgi:uncharacterized RDD family membrane protein YckC